MVMRAYREADLFVLPSLHEGYGMVFAEAMAHGLPIIATAAGAIPETVPREAGLVVRPGDAAALARALRRVIAEPALAVRLAAGSRAAVPASRIGGKRRNDGNRHWICLEVVPPQTSAV